MAPRSKEVHDKPVIDNDQKRLIISKDGRYSYTRNDVFTHVSKYAKANDWEAIWHVASTLALNIACYFLPMWIIPLHALITVRYVVVIRVVGFTSLSGYTSILWSLVADDPAKSILHEKTIISNMTACLFGVNMYIVMLTYKTKLAKCLRIWFRHM